MIKFKPINEFSVISSSSFSGFKEIINFFYVRIYLIIIIGLNLFLWLVSYLIKINVSQELIILHYNIDFGVDLIGSVNKIYIIPLLSLIILIINVILISNLVKHKFFKFITHLLLAACIMVDLFLLISLASIYLINFR
ncbi:MAG: hypothetical protein ABIG60_06225 [Patescibacteria group bacterium]